MAYSRVVEVYGHGRAGDGPDLVQGRAQINPCVFKKLRRCRDPPAENLPEPDSARLEVSAETVLSVPKNMCRRHTARRQFLHPRINFGDPFLRAQRLPPELLRRACPEQVCDCGSRIRWPHRTHFRIPGTAKFGVSQRLPMSGVIGRASQSVRIILPSRRSIRCCRVRRCGFCRHGQNTARVRRSLSASEPARSAIVLLRRVWTELSYFDAALGSWSNCRIPQPARA